MKVLFVLELLALFENCLLREQPDSFIGDVAEAGEQVVVVGDRLLGAIELTRA